MHTHPLLTLVLLSAALPPAAAAEDAPSPAPAAATPAASDAALAATIRTFLDAPDAVELNPEWWSAFYGTVSTVDALGDEAGQAQGQKLYRLTVMPLPDGQVRRHESSAVLCTVSLDQPLAEADALGHFILVRYIAPATPAEGGDTQAVALGGLTARDILLLPADAAAPFLHLIEKGAFGGAGILPCNGVVPVLKFSEAMERGERMFREQIRLYNEAAAVMAGELSLGDKAAQLDALREQALLLDCVDGFNAADGAISRLYAQWFDERMKAEKAFRQAAGSYLDCSARRPDPPEEAKLRRATWAFERAMLQGK